MPSSDTEAPAAEPKTSGFYGAMMRAMVQGVKHVMGAMAGLDIQAGRPVLKRPEQTAGEAAGIAGFAVSGIIGFAGEGRGSMALSFTQACALGLTAALFGEEKAEIDKEVEDTIGEFTNMICGDARRRLSEGGVRLEAGLPTVVSGEGHDVSNCSSEFTFVIPFESPSGPFALEASFEREKGRD